MTICSEIVCLSHQNLISTHDVVAGVWMKYAGIDKTPIYQRRSCKISLVTTVSKNVFPIKKINV